jgi:phosphoribosylformimino-5-aminoimidazole carboxamide ribotide isomerase
MDNNFIIFPAIDLKDGKCVRLKQGRAEDKTVYADDPVAMACRWQDEGARFLHVVDLDGAFEGKPVHGDVVASIADALDIPVEIGGGIRTDEHIGWYLERGVERVILGTRACAHPDDLKVLVEAHGAGLAVGIDARDGRVQVSGWTETTAMDAVELAVRMDEMGVKTIIYTDTSRDGMMKGVNADSTGALCDAVGCDIVASGGVSTVEDVRTLKALGKANLVGAIVGKALYEGAVSLDDLEKA